MSPFSQLLHDLRVRHGLRQADLAALIGYEQSYISALEVGLKGPPNMEFLDRVANAMSLSDEDRRQLWVTAQASQRKFVISSDDRGTSLGRGHCRSFGQLASSSASTDIGDTGDCA